MIHMKIEKGKPLPDHTKLDYYECCAKLILEDLFPERYGQLLIADKPDLQGENVGIEVTRANDPKMEEALNNWVKACSCEDESKRARYIQHMARLGVKYSGWVQDWPGRSPSFDLTKQAVETKIRKLASGTYKPFPRYELFVFTDTWYYETVVEDAKRYLFDQRICQYYKTVYVLSEGADLHIFETDTGMHSNILIDCEEQTNRNIRARALVEEAEED